MAKISGPLVDRIDIHLEVPSVPYRELASKQAGTSSLQMREQVAQAREIQSQRFAQATTRYNAQMSSREIRKHCELDSNSEGLLQTAMAELGLSARAHDRILRVARTIADLEGAAKLQVHHVSEAIGYRMLDRKLWT